MDTQVPVAGKIDLNDLPSLHLLEGAPHRRRRFLPMASAKNNAPVSTMTGDRRPTRCQYLQIGETFWNLEKSVLVLAWRLYLTRDRRLRSLGFGKRGIKELLLCRLGASRSSSIRKLAVAGDLGAEVHNGHLVFDLRRKSVAKLFSPNVSLTEIEREIRNIGKAQKLGFAPVLRSWDLHDRWYEMEYVSGESGWSVAPANREEFQKLYHGYIEACIESLIKAEPAKRVALGDHLKDTLGSCRALEKSKFDRDTIYTVRKFINYCAQRLQKWEDCQLFLAFSHGDFLSFNIIKVEYGVVVVDWETAAHRAALHDLYNYYFSHMFWNVPLILRDETADAVRSLRRRLAAEHRELSESIGSHSEVYRYFYYLERICILLQRKSVTDASRRILLRTIDVFERFESNNGYSDFFNSYLNVEDYEKSIYGPRSYDTYLWDLESAKLGRILASLKIKNGTNRHLDFACGTGRVLAAVRGITDSSVGLDLSGKMLSIARKRVPDVALVQSDITAGPDGVEGTFDVITAFRFFRNAEPKLRREVLSSLASRVRGSGGRLIFNVQWMPREPLRRRLLGGDHVGREAELTPSMSMSETRSLVAGAGMEIESWYGFGLCPMWMCRSRLRSVATFIDRVASRLPIIKMIPQNRVFVCRVKQPRGPAA